MTQVNKIDILQLSRFDNSRLITHPNLALNRGVDVNVAVGLVMKIGEPYRFMENRLARVLRGSLRVSVNLNEYRLVDGEALYIGQNSVVEILDYAPDTRVDLLGFAVSDNTHIQQVYHLGSECCKWLEAYLELIQTISTTQPYDSQSVDHLLLSLHLRIVSGIANSYNNSSHPKGRKEILFRSFIELLNTTLGKHELSFYAERLNISPQYLSRLTVEVGGIAAGEWINRAVILQAKLLLRNKQLTIEQIAEELNISTLPYFCRLFKREVGMTPSQYRTTQQK